MFIPEVSEYFEALTFHYVVPHRSTPIEEASMFQRFSPGVRETLDAFIAISQAPRDLIELTMGQTDLIGHRMLGRGHSVTPSEDQYLGELFRLLAYGLVIVVTLGPEESEITTKFLHEAGPSVCHVRLSDRRLSDSVLWEYCELVREKLAGTPGYDENRSAISVIMRRGLRRWAPRQLGMMDRNHLSTMPNVCALRSIGIRPQPWNGIPLCDQDNSVYFDAIKESADAIDSARLEASEEIGAIMQFASPSLILTAPAAIKEWRNISARIKAEKPDLGVNNSLIRKVIKQLYDRPNYAISLPESSLVDDQPHPDVGVFLAENALDMRTYSAFMSIKAASCFAPVIRLPLSVNGATAELDNLYGAVHATQKAAPQKLSRLVSRLSGKLAEGIPDWVIDRIRQSRSVKLVSDAPLEWLPIDGVPLMLRSEVSRVNVTPGNLYAQVLLGHGEVVTPFSQFEDILIIRSFSENDRLRHHTKFCIDSFAETAERFPKYRFVDVSTKEQLIHALNGYDGAILIYDGHGHHDANTDIGTIQLAGESVSAWDLRGEARVPPIVILSACDTHPFGASHATSANGFLTAGASCVLGTTVPIDARYAAIFITRLLLRIGMHARHVVTSSPWKSCRWSEVMPGMQRRQYISEVLWRLHRANLIRPTLDEFLQANYEISMAMECGGDWITDLRETVAELGKFPIETAIQHIAKQAGFVEALAYVQLGNPESVVVVED